MRDECAKKKKLGGKMDPGGSRLGKLKIGQLELYTFLARSSDSFAVANEKL